MDLLQTYSMIECQQTNPQCPYWERNPLVGKHPSKAEVTIVKLGLNILVYNLLDKKVPYSQRSGTLIALNVISLVPVIHNDYIGLGFYIPILPFRQFR